MLRTFPPFAEESTTAPFRETSSALFLETSLWVGEKAGIVGFETTEGEDGEEEAAEAAAAAAEGRVEGGEMSILPRFSNDANEDEVVDVVEATKSGLSCSEEISRSFS